MHTYYELQQNKLNKHKKKKNNLFTIESQNENLHQIESDFNKI